MMLQLNLSEGALVADALDFYIATQAADLGGNPEHLAEAKALLLRFTRGSNQADGTGASEQSSAPAIDNAESTIRRKLEAKIEIHEALLRSITNRFGAAIRDDEEINGGDAVEWLGEFVPLVEARLYRPAG